MRVGVPACPYALADRVSTDQRRYRALAGSAHVPAAPHDVVGSVGNGRRTAIAAELGAGSGRQAACCHFLVTRAADDEDARSPRCGAAGREHAAGRRERLVAEIQDRNARQQLCESSSVSDGQVQPGEHLDRSVRCRQEFDAMLGTWALVDGGGDHRRGLPGVGQQAPLCRSLRPGSAPGVARLAPGVATGSERGASPREVPRIGRPDGGLADWTQRPVQSVQPED